MVSRGTNDWIDNYTNPPQRCLLTAFLALFVTFIGSRLWHIACFTLHQKFQTDTPQDGLHHQRQAALRNSINEKTSLVSFIRILWAWRKRAKQPLLRLFPVIIFSSLAAVGFSIGSIFSAKISSSMGNEVLISSANCGSAGNTYGSSKLSQATADQLANIFNPWLAEKVTSFSNFVQTCYANSSENCGPYVKKRLLSTVDKNASCPFQGQICRHTTGNMRLDSGYLNSQTHLGINAPTGLQFKFRAITHCAPIESKGYTRPVYYSTDKPYVQYFYGPLTANNSSKSINILPFTYMVEQKSVEEISYRKGPSSAQYEIR